MSLIALLAFKANDIFEVYFYVKMLSKFLTLFFFQKLTDVATSVLGYCGFSNLMTSVKFFAAVLHIKEAKTIVVEDSGPKCTCNNSTRESENLKDLFCRSYTLNLN